MQSGDVVGFLADRYLHKLEPWNEEKRPKASESEAEWRDQHLKQIVFTCWTDKMTEQRISEMSGLFDT